MSVNLEQPDGPGGTNGEMPQPCKPKDANAATATSSKSAILNSVRTGVVLLFTGMGFAFANFGNASLLPLRIGIVLGCLGIGFLISAAISFWLARKFQREAKE